ncbi:hypothetical protein GCM10007897_30330 [Sphingobium jiangsuense]|nr:hypothetical protein GCM10007897_30330 [Sphingobium jiangsuense]
MHRAASASCVPPGLHALFAGRAVSGLFRKGWSSRESGRRRENAAREGRVPRKSSPWPPVREERRAVFKSGAMRRFPNIGCGGNGRKLPGDEGAGRRAPGLARERFR